MSRKDTIIVALLINTGLLALLFMLAINTEDDSVADYPEINRTLTESRNEGKTGSQSKNVAFADARGATQESDEVDSFLKELSSDESSQAILLDDDGYVEFVKEAPVQVKTAAKPEIVRSGDVEYVEVTVKRGDALEKIARNNGTTVEAIKQANGMASTKLSIGQTLKIPVAKGGAAQVATPAPKAPTPSTAKPQQPIAQATPAKAQEKASAADDSSYYVVKSGDTPWKIAKQNNVKFEDLLKLNGLNEEKARNLKPGDKIRVR